MAQQKKKSSQRSYRVLSMEADRDGWRDHGLFPGSSRNGALRRARQKDAALRKVSKEGAHLVACPVGHFQPVVATIETVERETFKAVGSDSGASVEDEKAEPEAGQQELAE
jgi:hypothetical protein